MKLQPLLEEYLVASGSLPLAGVGLLSIETKAATISTTEPVIKPPQIEIVFLPAKPSDDALQDLSKYIGQRLSVSNQQAAQLLSSDNSIASFVKGSGSFELPTFGLLQKENGAIAFRQAETFSTYLPAVLLPKKPHQPDIQPGDDKVLQPKEPEESIIPAEHLEETVELEPARKDYWWVWVVVIFVVSVLLILFRNLQ